MLQFIREKSQGWIAWTIIIAICIPFALWGVKSYLYGHSDEGILATVNGEKVTKRQVDFLYRQLKLQQQGTPSAGLTGPSATRTASLKQQALQSIISSSLLDQAVHQEGFRIAPELVEATLAKMPIFQVNGAFSSTRFEEILSRMLYTPEQFFEQLSDKILTNQVRSGLVDTAFALPYEAKQAEGLINQQRTFRYILIPFSQFTTAVSVQPKEIESYYQAHIKEFKTEEQVSIEYILLSLTDLMQTIKPTQEQLKLFYQSNLASFSRPQKWQIQNIFVPLQMNANSRQQADVQKTLQTITQKIKSGESFSSLIQKYSQDKSTAATEKSLPWISSSQVAPAINSVLVKMKKGDISNPIKISNGYQLIKVTDIQPSKVFPLEAVKDRLATTYKQQKAEQLFTNLGDQLANLTYETPNALFPAAQKLGLKVQETELFTRSGGKEPITKDPRVIKAAFGEDVLNQGNNSEIISLDNNRSLVLRKKLLQRSQVKPLEQVKPGILKILQAQKAKEKVNEVGTELLAADQQQQNIDKQMALYRLNWVTKKDVKMRDKTVNSEIALYVFQLPRPAANGSWVSEGSRLETGDYVLVQLLQVANASAGIAATQKRGQIEGMANGHGLLDFSAYFQGLMQKAKIKYYDKSETGNASSPDNTDDSSELA